MPKLLTEDDVHIYYRFLNKSQHPKKPVLIFIHGWVMNWTCFKNEIIFFKRKKYPVLYLDLRGHGKSDKPDRIDKYDFNLMAGDLKQVLDKEQVHKCILIGHSMGGMISLLFALNNPDYVSRLILIDSSCENPLFSPKIKYFHKHKKFAKLLADFIIEHTAVKKHFRRIKELDVSKLKSKSDIMIFLEGFIHTPLHSCFAVLEEMFHYDLREKLPKLKVPTLIIASQDDQFFTMRMAKYLKNRIADSKILVDQGTHSVIIKKPEEIAIQIYGFINEVCYVDN
ncbi:alpha/beta hydrolase [Candidatus Woesearchaeota archaeon]|nr:alpha/beta hydrolase [Candidatus Woesearchaeota archaeon]